MQPFLLHCRYVHLAYFAIMEDQTPFEKPGDLLEEILEVDEVSASHFRDAAVWGRAVGIIFVIMLVLGAAAMFYQQYLMSDLGADTAYRTGSFLGVIIAAAIFFPWALHLFRFGNIMIRSLDAHDEAGFGSAIRSLKIVLIYSGVLSILFLLSKFFTLFN